MHSSRSSELTGNKVCHGYLQHQHHHWRHHHRRQHNQHDVHQLFQGNLILRIPTMSLSPRHTLPYISDWDGLPREDLRWLQLITKMLNNFHYIFIPFRPLPLPPSKWSSVMIYHALFPQAPCSFWLPSSYYRSPGARGSYQTSKMITIICWYSPVCQSFLQASSCIVRLVSTFCLHESGNVISDLLTVFLLVMEMQMTMLVVCNFTVMA